MDALITLRTVCFGSEKVSLVAGPFRAAEITRNRSHTATICGNRRIRDGPSGSYNRTRNTLRMKATVTEVKFEWLPIARYSQSQYSCLVSVTSGSAHSWEASLPAFSRIQFTEETQPLNSILFSYCRPVQTPHLRRVSLNFMTSLQVYGRICGESICTMVTILQTKLWIIDRLRSTWSKTPWNGRRFLVRFFFRKKD